MAQSRLEKIGTVYSRITSLLRSKAMKEEDTPIWVAVYKAFPPKYEPTFDRQLPKKYIKAIFYEEDIVRARFHKDQSFIPAINLANQNKKSATQNFLSIYKTMTEEKKGSEDVYEQALQQYKFELETEIESRKQNKPKSFNN